MVNRITYLNDDDIVKREHYTYDKNGNVISVNENGSQVKSYTYDKIGRLIKEKDIDLEKEICYTYDEKGNILVKEVNGEKTYYGYGKGNSNYYDSESERLTKIGNESITYDFIGNPLTYRGATCSWERLNLLKSFTKDGETATFVYDKDKLLSKKTVGDEVTEYVWFDGKLIREKNMKKRFKRFCIKIYILPTILVISYIPFTYLLGYGFTKVKNLIPIGVVLLVLVVNGVIREVYARKKLLKTLKTSEMKIDKQFIYDSQAMYFDYEKRLIAILFYKKNSSIPVVQIVSFDDINDKKTEVRIIGLGKNKYLTLSFNINQNGKKEEVVMCEVLLKEDIPLGGVDLKEIIDKNEDFKKVNELSELIDGIK